jgi:carbonic anhydrase
VACMDSRMPIFQMLGLAAGDAHIIRNAGGVITDDVIRSLLLSQRLMGTQEVLLIHHTDCGQTRIREDQLRAELEAETGLRPAFSFEAFTDPFVHVRQSMRRLMASPFLPAKNGIHGLVYDVDTGVLHPVSLDD